MEFTALGRRLPRLDGPDRVTGRALYGADVTPAGAAHAACVRSPHAHARIVRVDAAAALALDGVLAVLTEADLVVEESFTLAATHQGYLEPQACSVEPTPDGRFTVNTSSQGHFTIRDNLALAFSLPLHALKVVPLEIGGGFGGKINPLPEIFALAAARVTGRPVKIVFSRAEVLLATRPGAPARVRAKIGATRAGRLTAADVTYEMEAGAYPGSPVGAAAYSGLAPYRLENCRSRGL